MEDQIFTRLSDVVTDVETSFGGKEIKRLNPDIDNMGFLVPFSTVGNGLWEMDKWEMGVGWLGWIRGFGVGNSWEIKDLGGNGG